MVDPSAEVADDVSIWHFAQVRERANVGAGTIIGSHAYLGTGVRVGRNCKIQNNALIYEPAVLEDGVFIGPAVILTNDHWPRAVRTDGLRKQTADWSLVGVTVHEGASIGAGAVCVAPLTIGRWAMVGAGAVVTRDVDDYSLVAGSPAVQVGWVGRSGHRLRASEDDPTILICPVTNERYRFGPQGVLKPI